MDEGEGEQAVRNQSAQRDANGSTSDQNLLVIDLNKQINAVNSLVRNSKAYQKCIHFILSIKMCLQTKAMFAMNT